MGEDASLNSREGDGLFGLVRVNTGKTVAIFSNLGKVYVMRALDVPRFDGLRRAYRKPPELCRRRVRRGYSPPILQAVMQDSEAPTPVQEEEATDEADGNGHPPSQIYFVRSIREHT